MRYLVPALILVAIVVGLAIAADKEPAKKTGVLAVLEPGQKVSLKETGGGFQIAYIPGLAENSHRIMEVGPDFVIVEDIAGVTQTRIPIYAVKAVTVTTWLHTVAFNLALSIGRKLFSEKSSDSFTGSTLLPSALKKTAENAEGRNKNAPWQAQGVALGFKTYSLVKPGAYQITVRYENAVPGASKEMVYRDVDRPLAAGSWAGTVTSNEITLTVKPVPKAEAKPVNGLKMELAADPTEFVFPPNTGFIICQLKTTFTNLTDKPIRLARFPQLSDLATVEVNGASPECFNLVRPGQEGRSGPTSREDFLACFPVIQPKQTWTGFCPLGVTTSAYFAEKRFDLKPGDYRLKLTYTAKNTKVSNPDNQNDVVTDCWTGSVASNEFTITVKLPNEGAAAKPAITKEKAIELGMAEGQKVLDEAVKKAKNPTGAKGPVLPKPADAPVIPPPPAMPIIPPPTTGTITERADGWLFQWNPKGKTPVSGWDYMVEVEVDRKGTVKVLKAEVRGVGNQ